jgi:hypothetical protein
MIIGILVMKPRHGPGCEAVVSVPGHTSHLGRITDRLIGQDSFGIIIRVIPVVIPDQHLGAERIVGESCVGADPRVIDAMNLPSVYSSAGDTNNYRPFTRGSFWGHALAHSAVYIRANMMRIVSAVILGFLVVASADPAFAEKRQTHAAREKAAKKACAMGNFEKGADILTDLFVETNDPIYVYNQGRCYQQNSRWEQAISRFREFLRKAQDLPESDRADARRQIADCEASLGKTAQVAPPPVAPTPPAPTPYVETLLPVPSPTLAETYNKPEPPPSDGSRGKGLRVAGIILASVGVAAVGTGVGLALKANSLSTADYSQSRESERASLKTWGLVSYGVGAAAIASGVVLYAVGWPSQQSSSVALLPVAAPDGAYVLLRGRF